MFGKECQTFIRKETFSQNCVQVEYLIRHECSLLYPKSSTEPFLFRTTFSRYEQQLREKLARRRDRLAKGLPPEDSEDEEDTEKESADGKSLLENIERRFVRRFSKR